MKKLINQSPPQMVNTISLGPKFPSFRVLYWLQNDWLFQKIVNSQMTFSHTIRELLFNPLLLVI